MTRRLQHRLLIAACWLLIGASRAMAIVLSAIGTSAGLTIERIPWTAAMVGWLGWTGVGAIFIATWLAVGVALWMALRDPYFDIDRSARIAVFDALAGTLAVCIVDAVLDAFFLGMMMS